MNTHTPGPWAGPSRSNLGNDCWRVGEGLPSIAVAKRFEDALLIAAAPELLEAAKFILQFDSKKIGSISESMLRRAIAKATKAQEIAA